MLVFIVVVRGMLLELFLFLAEEAEDDDDERLRAQATIIALSGMSE